MRNPDLSKSFPDFLRDAVDKCCERIHYSKLEQGDSLALCDENPFQILHAVKNINKKITEQYPDFEMRFAGSAGYVEFGDEHSGVSGLAILEAARVEPHVPPGRVLVTGEFKAEIQRSFGIKNVQIDPVGASDLPHLRHENGRFNIAKSEKEEPLWRELFYLSLRENSALGRLISG